MNSPFEDDINYQIDTIDLGKVRDLFLYNDTLFVSTENEGIYIYKTNSENNSNSILLSNGNYLEELYQSRDWGIGKDIKSIYYSNSHQILFALDYNNNTYLGYTEFLLNDIEDFDNLIQNSCGPDANARKFFINTSNINPEIYVLYKCFDSSSQCVENPYSNVSSTIFTPFFGDLYTEFQTFGDFSTASVCGTYTIDDLYPNTNDMYFNSDKFFIANPSEGSNSFGVYNMQGELLDEYLTESVVRSVYSINDYILAGTEDGCYITLLDGDSIYELGNSKLVIADNFTIYDIFYSDNKLILSCGSDGVLIYDWDGTSSEFYEDIRLFPSDAYYGTKVRVLDNIYFIGTEDGLEIFNIEE